MSRSSQARINQSGAGGDIDMDPDFWRAQRADLERTASGLRRRHRGQDADAIETRFHVIERQLSHINGR